MTTMSTATLAVRTALADAVLAAYPDPATRPLVGDLGPTDPPQRATVLVASSRVDPPDVACPARRYTVRAWVIGAVTAPGAADPLLDTLLDVALAGLDAAGLGWTEAVRGVWADQNPCYELSVEMTE